MWLASPVGGWTAFQAVSGRHKGLIGTGWTGAHAPRLTSGAGSARRPARGTGPPPDSWRQTPAAPGSLNSAPKSPGSPVGPDKSGR